MGRFEKLWPFGKENREVQPPDEIANNDPALSAGYGASRIDELGSGIPETFPADSLLDRLCSSPEAEAIAREIAQTAFMLTDLIATNAEALAAELKRQKNFPPEPPREQ
jgi:hypothetical protein